MTKKPKVQLTGSGGEWAYSVELGSRRVFGELSGVTRAAAEKLALQHFAGYMRGEMATDPAKYGSLTRELELREEVD